MSPRPAALDYLQPNELRPLALNLWLSLGAFGIGILAGLAQALDRVLPITSTIWNYFPLQKNYYQGLTMHGVILALVFTFAFANGFLPLVTAAALRTRPPARLLWASFLCLAVGTLLAGSQILLNSSSVLFTMYPPLQATPAFYLGAALTVVSTWLAGLAIFVTYRRWRATDPTERVPLQAYASIATYAMWILASLGVAAEVLILLLPWSLSQGAGGGVAPLTDPQLARTLFWFSGHPIVYFWLLPVYVSWYTMVPRQVGGKILSDPLARLVFALFLVLSIPTGFHHQFTDPGIPLAFKRVHLIGTFAIFLPSVITAFSVIAALEMGGRARGGRGLFGWIRTLPWGDPSVTAQLLAMMAFALGGVSGLINASYNVNLQVHNSAWVPGHFHLTVGTAVALSILGIAYWLVPHTTGRALWGRRAAVLQSWLWFAGVLIFSRGQMAGGLAGLPRRLNVSQMPAGYHLPEWDLSHAMTAIGGTVMFVSGVLFFVVIGMTLWKGRSGAAVEMPVAEAVEPNATHWPILDRWSVWVGIAVALVLLAYGPYFATYVPNFVSKGWRLWGG